MTQKEKTCLRLYQERLDEAQRSSVVQSGKESLRTSCKIEDLLGEQRVGILFDGYPDADFRAFAAIFRQFTMQSEKAVYVKKVHRIFNEHCGRNDLKALADLSMKRWDDLMASGPAVRFELGGKHYTNADVLHLWLYSGRFHTDINKANICDSLPELARKDAEASIQVLTNRLLNCLVIIGSVIRIWLDEPAKTVPVFPEN